MLWISLAFAGSIADGVEALELLRQDPSDDAAFERVVESGRDAGVKELWVDAVLARGEAPPDLEPEVAFAAGMRAWRNGDGAQAVEWFEKVPEGSDDRVAATLLRARSARKDGRLKTAVMLAREATTWKGPAVDAHRVELLKDLAALEIVNIYDRLDRESNALEYLDLIPPGSPIARHVAARRADLHLDAGDERGARKTMKRAPRGDWSPEVPELAARLAATRCKGDAADVFDRARTSLETHSAGLRAITRPANLPKGIRERLLVWDVQRLFDEAEKVGAETDAAYVAELELSASHWLQIQVDLEQSRIETALVNVKSAADRCAD